MCGSGIKECTNDGHQAGASNYQCPLHSLSKFMVSAHADASCRINSGIDRLVLRVDTHFRDIGGHPAVIESCTSTRFVNCTFSDLSATPDTDAAIPGDIHGFIPPSILHVTEYAQAWLQGCTFSGNDIADDTLLLVDQTSAIYADAPQRVYVATGDLVRQVQTTAVPPNASSYLSIDDPVIVAAAKVRVELLPPRN